MRYRILFFILIISSSFAHAQKVPHLFQTPEKLALMKTTLRQMYNWEFSKAEANLSQFRVGYENHPAVPFTEAMILFWRNAPMNLFSNDFAKHEKLVVEASDLADKMLEEDEEDMEAIFFKMAARSLLMKYYADKDEKMKALTEARGVYKLMKKGFDLKEDLNEFYFTTGIYNYYREYYPEKYPWYKPFAWVFQSGNKELGLEQLEYTARNASFTSPEAYTYLTYIYLRYENKNDKALSFAKELQQRFPRNKLFLANYIETLMLAKKYSQVNQLSDQLISYRNDIFYPASGHLFKGIVQDFQYNNLDKAYEHYAQAEKSVNTLGFRFAAYKTYLFYGLSRYWSSKGEGDKAKEYYQKAKNFDLDNYLKTVDKPDFK